jgi:hypothetical protein
MLKLLTKFKRCTKGWEYAEPNSKLARERYYTTNPGFESNIVTGGSGFGLMIIAGLIEVLFQEQKLFPD